jgi:ParB-like chromosome segregation protein Spo0J
MRSRHDTLHPAAQQMTHGTRGSLPSPTPESAIQRIALNRLGFPPGRRRRISLQSIHALAARMHATGQIQSLMVAPGEGSQYWVVAGDRRFAALLLLASQGRIAPTFGVPCRVINAKAVTEAAEFNVSDSATERFEPDERRRRFADLLHECPGLLTGSECAARQCFT